jgi:hypothetical protein
MTWNLIVARAARKHLARLPAKDQDRIAAALQAMSLNPFSGDIVKLDSAGAAALEATAYSSSVQVASRTVVVSVIARRISTTY